MPTTITLESGETQEVYTAEELTQQRDAALEEYKTANPDKTVELDALQAELKKANDELGKFKDKDLNFGNLRTQKEAAEKKVEEILKGVDDKIAIVKKEVLEGVMKDHYTETLKTLAGDDSELIKKIEYQYKRLTDFAATKEEVTKKMTDAYLLATKVPDTGVLNSGVLSSAGGGKLNIKSNQPFSAEEKALAYKFAQAGGYKLEEKELK